MSVAIAHGGPAAAPPPPEPAPAPVNYLNVSHTIWSWLFTVDHKRIGILYLISIIGVLHRRRGRRPGSSG